MEVLDPLLTTSVTWVAVDLGVARRAAELRARHDHRERRPISLSDALLLAAAGADTRIATADPDVIAIAHAESIDVIELPSQG